MFDEKYAGYTFSCYAIVVVVLVIMTLWIVLDEKKQEKLLKEFEKSKAAKIKASNHGEAS